MKLKSNMPGGFTGVDLLIVVVTVALLAIWLPWFLARARAKGSYVSCVSNLKQIGLAARMYANDNNDTFPREVSERVRANDTNRLVRFACAMSNELNTPKVLTCPQEKERRKAADFAKLTTTNISYFLALGPKEEKPDSLLAGDHNVTGGIPLGPFFRVFMTNTPAGWTPEPHNHAGNLLFGDGSAQQVNSNGFWNALQLSNRVARLALP